MSLIDAEIGYIFTNNYTYLTAHFSISEKKSKKVSEIVKRNPLVY